jgi:hypothetical protein
MSMKNAVTSLRSPSNANCGMVPRLTEIPVATFGAASRASLISRLIGLPQALQKRVSGGFEAPQ